MHSESYNPIEDPIQNRVAPLDVLVGSGVGPAEPLSLCHDEIHVWTTRTDDETLQDINTYLDWLSSEERGRYWGFVREKDRRMFLLAHAQVRRLLSLYDGVTGEREWTFQTDSYGWPRISNFGLAPPLYFSLSHTLGMSATAIARVPDIGIDVENTLRNIDFLEIARASFTHEEFQRLSKPGGKDPKRRFFEQWTLKESFVKARHLGLSLPLNGFSIHLGDETAELECVSSADDAFHKDGARGWHFHRFQPSPLHQAALAVHTGRETPVSFVIRQLTL